MLRSSSRPPFAAPFLVELIKLNRSLAALLAVTAPTLIGVFLFFMLLRARQPSSWDMWIQSGVAVWGYFMLPMSVTALTALVAHMEHGPRSWDHLRALPSPRWRLYAAKATGVLVVLALMSAGVLALSALGVWVASLIRPAMAPTGPFDLLAYAAVLARMYAAALLLVAVQLWIALRFASFVPALAAGIGGTFFAVVATVSRAGVFLPWQMPVNVLAGDAWRVQTVLALGGAGGVIALILMTVFLARREVR